MTPSTALVPAQSKYDDPKLIEAIKQTVAKGANDGQLRMFLEVCKASGLNPFLKEIWFIPETGAIMAARDGYLRVANEHPMFDGMETRVERDDKGIPIKAVCTVWRKDRSHPVICEAYYNEYAKQSKVWQTYKSALIGKVAEVLSLKRSFAINGTVTEDEISDTPRGGWNDSGSQEQADAVIQRKLEAAGIKDDRVAISENLREVKRVISEYTDSQEIKKELLELAFGTHTWSKVEMMELDVIATGLRKICTEIAARSEKAAHLTEQQLFRSLNKFRRLDAFSAMKARIGELAYYRILKAHGVEKSNQFQSVDAEWSAYLEMSGMVDLQKAPGMDAFDKHMAEPVTMVPSHVKELKQQLSNMNAADFVRILATNGYEHIVDVPADEAPAIMAALKEAAQPVGSF